MSAITTLTLNNGTSDLDFEPQYRDPQLGVVYINHSATTPLANRDVAVRWSPSKGNRRTERGDAALVYRIPILNSVTSEYEARDIARGDISFTIPYSASVANRTAFADLLKNLANSDVIRDAIINADPPIG